MLPYTLEQSTLIIKPKQANYLVLAVLIVLCFLCLALPIMGFVLTIIEGDSPHFGGIILLGLMALISFYLLRLILWNSCGKEIFVFEKNSIQYTADYNWFKDKVKTISVKGDIQFAAKEAGFKEDKTGVLLIISEEEELESVVKMPIDLLQQLVLKLPPKKP
ncbi:MAG: hypothetical protein MH472_13535 [Bacteroidia bacterium]|nr:hypothetical protein [Bacteroidia bacterium]MDP3930056.1 hypothetical protein [Bacteroidota bacterium]